MKLQALIMAAFISGSPLMLDDGCCETQTYYHDIDGDGFGNESETVEACEAPSGYVSEGGDCDDHDAAVSPDAAERCNDGIDNNCDGFIDEACVVDDDADGDGYTAEEDCNDRDPAINPGAEEVCDGIDNNCDGQVDEYCAEMRLCSATGGEWSTGCVPSSCEIPCGECVQCIVEVELCACPEDAPYWDDDLGCHSEDLCEGNPVDADGDGFPADEDCDDDNPRVNPRAEEICDGIDNDCDGTVDEGCDDGGDMRLCEATGGEWTTGCGPATCEDPCGGECVECLVEVEFCFCPEDSPYWDEENGCISEEMCEVTLDDADGDGYPAERDCNDRDPSTYPGAPEVCDAVDNDCDGVVDEGCR